MSVSDGKQAYTADFDFLEPRDGPRYAPADSGLTIDGSQIDLNSLGDPLNSFAVRPTVTKAKLVSDVSDLTGLTQTQANLALNAVLESIAEELGKGGVVTISGFGKFSVAQRAARQGINPATGRSLRIAASKVPKFRAGSRLKRHVSELADS